MKRFALAALMPVFVTTVLAQSPAAKFGPGGQGSSNVHVLSHVPLGRLFTVGDIEAEQELSRPYVYVPRMQGTTHSTGFTVVSVKDPRHAKAIYTWTMEKPELLRA